MERNAQKSLTELAAPFHDAFLSHVEAETPLARELYEHLRSRGLNIFFDKSLERGISPAESVPGRISNGLRRSRGGIILASSAYFQAEGYAKLECDALINLGVYNKEMPVIAVLAGITHAELRELNPLLAVHLNVSLSDGMEHVVDVLTQLFKPPSPQIVVRDTRHAPDQPPSDALPPDNALTTIRPQISLKVEFDAPGGQEHFSLAIGNSGADAQRVALDLPGVGPVRVAESLRRDDTIFVTLSVPRVEHLGGGGRLQTVLEFEDRAANLYRQYAPVSTIFSSEDVRLSYDVGSLGEAHLVAQRIVDIGGL